MQFLSRLPSDSTFRQSEIPNLIQGLGPHLYSADMTAFTDTFPIELEKELVRLSFGAETSDLWELIISNRVFHHPKGGVKYAAGNPMGVLSSWPISTATHHAVKHYCAHLIHGSKKYKYLILGDDSLDSCPLVYEKYIEVLSKLGVTTSLSKCTRSDSGYAEFAKRLFSPRGEITGLPVTLLEEVYTKPEQFIELVRICRERGYSDQSLIPGVGFLLERSKRPKLIADVLSLPQAITGAPPLLGANTGS